MGTSALRQFLKSLCNSSPWRYAVFWKLNELMLTWEDGYCHNPKPGETLEHTLDEVYFGDANEMLSENCAASMHDGGSAGYQIGLVVADMSHLQHTFGKGVVGEVAVTGNHRWVFLDSFCTSGYDSELVPDEWLLQFALGIKTILLVPVLPYGVLQLGSLKKVSEDLAVVGFVKDQFNVIHNVVGNTVPFTLTNNFHGHSSWSRSSSLENTFEPLDVTINPRKVERSEDAGNIRLNDNLFSMFGQFMQLQTFEDSLLQSGTDQPEIPKSTGNNEIGVPAACHIGESSHLSQSIDTSLLEMVETQLFGLSCLEEELLAYSQYGGFSAEVLEESLSGFNSCSAGGIAEQFFKQNNSKDTSHNMVDTYFSFPDNCELHKALGTAFQGPTNEHLWDSTMNVDDTSSSSSLQKNPTSGIEPSWFSERSYGDNLMEASVPKDDSSSSRSDNIKSSLTSLSPFSTSCKQKMKFEAAVPIGSDAFTWSHTSAFLSGGKTSDSFTGMMSTLVDEEQQGKGITSRKPKKEHKVSGASGRRSKQGNTPKLRPRDRQLIQDRVKELRELVPNGDKCSIDGLLDRTVKHMLYLRSISDQAEKLRSYADQQVPRANNMDDAKISCENGTSRAFEIGSEPQICPIVVEDLGRSGHMLVEMLCDEHGLFLDIAQAIRRLDLTILKGIMEPRSSNMWAHFVVQAPRGFHRMDIFWPLLHLLQRRRSTISCKI